MATEKLVGVVTHYYNHLGVAVLELYDTLAIGQRVHIKGAHDDFEQHVQQLQFENVDIPEAHAGEQVGMKVERKVHEHDEVYSVE